MNTSSDSSETPFDFDVSRWGSLPGLCGLFVTGTDTGVGKTLIAGAIARHLRKAGRVVDVFKPAASGCRTDRGRLVSPDAEFLAACGDSARTLAEITPVTYAQPVAPNVAADREGRAVDLEAIFAAYRNLADSAADAVIVEGIGGLLCPISDDFWVIHLARMMALPVVIVARAGLGTINHTLLTLQAARCAGLRVAGVVINRYQVDPEGDPAVATNPAQIAQRGRTAVLALVPDDPRTSVQEARIGKDVQFAIQQVDWEQIMRSAGPGRSERA